MSNFFSSSGADDPPSGGNNFFSFKDAPQFKSDKSEEQAGAPFSGNSSFSGGGDHDGFFKPSSASKNEGGFLDFDSALSKPEVEPTFLAPFSRTPPRKRQNQGPPPTPVCQPALQQSAIDAKMEGSDTSTQQSKGNSDSSLGSHVRRPSHSTVSSLEPAPSALSSYSPTFGGATASPSQQNSNTQINAASGRGYNSQSMCGTQQFKEKSSDLMSEAKCGIEEADLKDGREKKIGGTMMPSGRMGGSIVEHNSSGQPTGRGSMGASSIQGGHLVGGGQGLLKQLLAQQTQRLAELLTPELEKALSNEERMVQELEQVEQEGKAYRLQLEGMKERFGGRLGQISGFLGLSTKK